MKPLFSLAPAYPSFHDELVVALTHVVESLHDIVIIACIAKQHIGGYLSAIRIERSKAPDFPLLRRIEVDGRAESWNLSGQSVPLGGSQPLQPTEDVNT